MSQPQRALIVIDVQNEYFTGKLRIAFPPVAQSLANICRAMDAATAAGIPVAVVQHLANGSSLDEIVLLNGGDEHISRAAFAQLGGNE